MQQRPPSLRSTTFPIVRPYRKRLPQQPNNPSGRAHTESHQPNRVQIPIETVAPPPPTSRDFVPWRFSDACRPARRCIRHPGVRETCTIAARKRTCPEVRVGSQHGRPCTAASAFFKIGQTLNRDYLILSADQVSTDEHETNSHSLLQHLPAIQRFLGHARKKPCQHDTEHKHEKWLDLHP